MKIRIFLLMVLFFPAAADAASFVNPIGFKDTEANRQKVVEFIKENTYNDYCKNINMCSPVTLRMMEKENLEAFKYLIQADNHTVLQQTIDNYCGQVGMCNYTTIKMMYDENNKASKEELKW